MTDIFTLAFLSTFCVGPGHWPSYSEKSIPQLVGNTIVQVNSIRNITDFLSFYNIKLSPAEKSDR
ncbi:hypothetical protein E2C01_015649 [Portunus trituberculatus]|uniref:Uncharacterized protein n=1 Tax=Portunus trituberculatus TaxID=210409 RepID=A0A5B7DM58_PORTR|nr:hypothetical protein [Portunus trituberculatus]